MGKILGKADGTVFSPYAGIQKLVGAAENQNSENGKGQEQCST